MSKSSRTHFGSLTGFRHDKEKTAKRRKILGVLFVFALVVLIFRTPAERWLGAALQFIARPLWGAQESVQSMLANSSYLLRSRASLAAENASLQNSLDLVALEAHSREALRAENDRLKQMLGRHAGRDFMLARVLYSPGGVPYDTMVIDAGSDHGVAVGMRVYIDGDFVLGQVEKVYGRSSVVTLYSSSGNELPVLVGTSTVPATAYGSGGGNFRVVLPRGVPASAGDLISLPSLAPTYLGTIDAIERPEGSSLQAIYFKWPVNIFQEQWVYVELHDEVEIEAPAE